MSCMQMTRIASVTVVLGALVFGNQNSVVSGRERPTIKGTPLTTPRGKAGLEDMRGAMLMRGTSAVVNHSMPVAIDGALTPEQIPDYVAYRHLIIALAADGAQSTQRDHIGALANGHFDARPGMRDAVLRDLGLSEVDRAALLEAVVPAYAGLQSSLSKDAKTSARRALRDGVFQQTRTKIDASLSPAARDRVHAFLQAIKSQIKVYGTLPQ
jgi:hypothetical protein